MDRLSEEEKKAIEYLENRLDILHNNTQWATENSIKVVLNLIEKQQKELDKEKEKNKELNNLIYQKLKLNIIENGMSQNDYISKDKIRELFKKLNKIKSRTDGKVNAWDYMILGDTTRATGRFINLDYIEKILFDEDGYSIGE